MAVNIAKEMRQALGWSCQQADSQLGLASGTWERVEQKQVKLSIKQMLALGAKTLRASFGATVLSESQLDSYNAEMEKLGGLIVMLQQNEQSEHIKSKLAEAADILQSANSIIAK